MSAPWDITGRQFNTPFPFPVLDGDIRKWEFFTGISLHAKPGETAPVSHGLQVLLGFHNSTHLIGDLGVPD